RASIHDNDVSLANVDQNGSPNNAGAGCILYYIGAAYATQGDARVHDNRCSDSGYMFQLALGQSVQQNVLVENLDVHDNHVFTINRPTLVGIRIINNSVNGCGGSPCSWTFSHLTFANNDVAGATTPWYFDTTGLTY